jgi:probable selenium-dependent hydroxylase accessory protein YqeC
VAVCFNSRVPGLLAAFDIDRGLVALAGAGGKTTLLYGLAAEAYAAGRTVVVTTTTHMGRPRETEVGPVIFDDGHAAPIVDALAAHGRVVLLGVPDRDDKVGGVTPERADALTALADLVLVEADGARRRSFKVPASHEPVVPRTARLVIVVAGLDALGRPLDDEHVHRRDLVSAAAAQPTGTPISEETLVRALTWPEGYSGRIPATARAAVFLNKAEDEGTLAAAERMAVRLLPAYERVVAGSARTGVTRTWHR